MIVVERELPLEQPIVHLPERALRGSGLGRFRGVLGLGMDHRQREFTEDKAELRAQPPLQFLDGGIRSAAVRTLKIPVLHQCQRRILAPNAVIIRPDRHRQVGAVVTPAHGHPPVASTLRVR